MKTPSPHAVPSQKQVALLQDMRKHKGGKWLLSEINRRMAPESSSYNYNKFHLSRWEHGRKIPSEVAEAIDDVHFTNFTPYGSMTIELQDGPVTWVVGLLRQGKVGEAIDMATRLHRSCNVPEEVETRSRLASILGQMSRSAKKVVDARDWFQLAFDDAPHNLRVRYHTNLLSIRRELHCKKTSISIADLKDELEAILSTQKSLLTQTNDPKDQAHALKHCLRLASLTKNNTAFEEFLRQARTHKGFGQNDKDRDQALRNLFSEEHDEDGDFIQARGSFSSYKKFANSDA